MSHHDRTAIPSFLRGLIDDAAVFPPGNASVIDALGNHRAYRKSWYEGLVGPLLLPAGKLPQLPDSGEAIRIGLIADTGIDSVASAIATLPEYVEVAQVEARAPDAEALETLLEIAPEWAVPVFAELPLDPALPAALARLGPTTVIPKFRTGGLSADLFPAPADLAKGITGCAEQGLSFKLTAGLHRAVRHRDPATGFTHHGFANILAAALEADGGASVETVTDTLMVTESGPLGDRIRGQLAHPRPLCAGFGSCSIAEPLEDLIGLSLVYEES